MTVQKCPAYTLDTAFYALPKSTSIIRDVFLPRCFEDFQVLLEKGGFNCGMVVWSFITSQLIYVPLSQTTSNNVDNKLDKKVEDCRRKLLRCPSRRLDSWYHGRLIIDLASALFDRFQQQGGIEYLEESITYYRQSLNLHPIGNFNHSTILSNLANAVSTRFHQLGGMENLEEAITYYRQALALEPHGHPRRPSTLNNLAIAASTRFRQLGGMKDLEEAITCLRQALALEPHGHPGRPTTLNNLASVVSTRFDQSGRMEDLEEAITGFGGGDHMSPSCTCSRTSWPSQSFIDPQ